MCILFIIWRRADSFRRVVAHQLRTLPIPQSEGRIRLSIDDGPPAREFLDDYDDDHEPLPPPPPPPQDNRSNGNRTETNAVKTGSS
ncbi:hypothetical protein C0995_015427 [Termitomyces sp. Mi166|nr:hypothetical protein C0995_015427 [Termitomyces sp. Mi166\